MKIFIKLLFLSVSLSSFSQSIETYKKKIDLETDSKKIAQEMALNEISRDLIIEILGKKEYQKKRSQIEKHIVKNRNRYVLSISSSSGKMQETGKFRFIVNIKISKNNLSDLLKQYSFLKVSKSSYCILPLISFSSQFGKEKQTWSWWILEKPSSESFLYKNQIASSFFDSLGREFTKIGFYFIDPIFQKTAQAVSSSLLPKKSNKMKYFKPLMNFYSCDMILSGFVHIGKSREGRYFLSNELPSEDILNTTHWIQFVIKGFNRKTKESLFELSRQFPLEKTDQKFIQKEMELKSKKIIESLIYQFSFYQETGSLGLDRLMIALQGDFSYSEKERLINQVTQRVNDLKNIQIVYLSSQRAVYRVETSKTLSEVIKDLKALKLKDFVFQVRKSSRFKLEIYAKTKKSK